MLYVRLFATRILRSANLMGAAFGDSVNGTAMEVNAVLNLYDAKFTKLSSVPSGPERPCRGSAFGLSARLDQCQEVSFAVAHIGELTLTHATESAGLSLAGAQVGVLEMANATVSGYLDLSGATINRLVVSTKTTWADTRNDGSCKRASVGFDDLSVTTISDPSQDRKAMLGLIDHASQADSTLAAIDSALRKNGAVGLSNEVNRHAAAKSGPGAELVAWVFRGPLWLYLLLALGYLSIYLLVLYCWSDHVVEPVTSNTQANNKKPLIWCLFYATDSFLPSFIDLHVKDRFTLKDGTVAGWLMRSWILIGWIILSATVFVIAGYIK